MLFVVLLHPQHLLLLERDLKLLPLSFLLLELELDVAKTLVFIRIIDSLQLSLLFRRLFLRLCMFALVLVEHPRDIIDVLLSILLDLDEVVSLPPDLVEGIYPVWV